MPAGLLASASPRAAVGDVAARRRAAAPVSIPTSAAGSTPTGVSTLNRPPTADGMSSAGIPSVLAISRSAPFCGIGDEHEVVARVAESLRQPLAHDQVLRHRLRRAARLRRDDEQRAVERETIEQRRDRVRIDVVEHVQSRQTAALVLGQRVPRGLEQRGAKRDRSERRAADAKHDDLVELAARPSRRSRSTGDAARRRWAATRNPSSPASRRRTSPANARRNAAGADVQSDAATPPSIDVAHHVGVVDAERHCQSMRTVSPSNAGTIPGGNSASRSAWKLSCVRCVRYVRSAPISSAAVDRFGNAEVRGMLGPKQRVDHEHLRATQQLHRLGRERLRVGDVGQRSDSIAEDVDVSVRNADRRDLDVADRERLSRLSPDAPCPRAWTFRAAGEWCRRRCSGTSARARSSVSAGPYIGQRRLATIADRAKVVDAVRVVGVIVREQHGVHVVDPRRDAAAVAARAAYRSARAFPGRSRPPRRRACACRADRGTGTRRTCSRAAERQSSCRCRGRSVS